MEKENLEQRLGELRQTVNKYNAVLDRGRTVLFDQIFTKEDDPLLHELAKVYIAADRNFLSHSEILVDTEVAAETRTKYGLPGFINEANPKVKEIAELVQNRPVEERLMAYAIADEIMKFNLGCNCHNCDVRHKKPMNEMFGIEKYQGQDWGMCPDSRPDKRVIKEVLLELTKKYVELPQVDIEDIREQTKNINCLLSLEKKGVNLDVLKDKQPVFYRSVIEFPEHLGFDEDSGVLVALSDHHWYQPLSSGHYRTGTHGGIGMAKIVTLLDKNQKVQTYQYTWRDQHDPNKDNDSNYLRKIIGISVEDDSAHVSFETPLGERTIAYLIE